MTPAEAAPLRALRLASFGIGECNFEADKQWQASLDQEWFFAQVFGAQDEQGAS